MKTPLHNTNRFRGFTLLEAMLAVLIMVLTATGIFKFVQSNIRAISYSVEDTEDTLALERLVALVQEELYSIPPRQQATLLGESLRTSGKDFDSMEFSSRGGPGLMTTAATGEFRVHLMVRPLPENSSRYEIGLKRRPVLLDTAGGLVAGGSERDATWIRLLPNVTGLKIRYWDARIQQYIDNWRDQGARPTLVLISILREGDIAPYEAVLTVPAALTQQ